MDILSICPPTKDVIHNLKNIINNCTKTIRRERHQHNSNTFFQTHINNINIDHEPNSRNISNFNNINDNQEMNLLEKCINFSKIKSSQLIFNTKIVKNKNKKDLEEERKLEEVAILNEDANENTNKIVKETIIIPKNNDNSIKEVTKQSQKLLKPFSINRTTELRTTTKIQEDEDFMNVSRHTGKTSKNEANIEIDFIIPKYFLRKRKRKRKKLIKITSESKFCKYTNKTLLVYSNCIFNHSLISFCI